MPCSIAMAWSSRHDQAPPCHRHASVIGRRRRTTSGVPTTRASSSSATKAYCYPLTVTDHASRYLLLCEALESTREDLAFTAFERLFQERGLPGRHPFRQRRSLRLRQRALQFEQASVWWLRLGIAIERIKPGHPQQNGRHERMHLTLKKEATRPPGMNSLQQQAKFDTFLQEFNTERPHEALAMKCPAERLQAFNPDLSRPPRAQLSLPRQRDSRHRLRPHLPAPQEDQSLNRLRRPNRRHQGSRRWRLARLLHAL